MAISRSLCRRAVGGVPTRQTTRYSARWRYPPAGTDTQHGGSEYRRQSSAAVVYAGALALLGVVPLGLGVPLYLISRAVRRKSSSSPLQQ